MTISRKTIIRRLGPRRFQVTSTEMGICYYASKKKIQADIKERDERYAQRTGDNVVHTVDWIDCKPPRGPR